MLTNFALAGWAYVLHRRRRPLSRAFWQVQSSTVQLLGLQILLGLGLLAVGLRPPTKLHYLYALLAGLAVLGELLLHPDRSLGRMLREEGHFSEAGTYSLLTLAAGLFALRLWMTGVGLP